MCYRGNSADSKWFAPEIRGSAAQIRSKFAINDTRRGTSRAEPRDGPSRRLLSCVTRVTHIIRLTPLPGTAPGAGKSPQETVRDPDTPPHTPLGYVRNFPSGRSSFRAYVPSCPSQSDPFLAQIVIATHSHLDVCTDSHSQETSCAYQSPVPQQDGSKVGSKSRQPLQSKSAET